MKGEDQQMREMLLQKTAIKNGSGQAKPGKNKPFASSKVTAASPPNPNSGKKKSGSKLLTLGVLIILNSVYGIFLILQVRGITFSETAEAVIWGYNSGVSIINAWYFYGKTMKRREKKKQEEEKAKEEKKQQVEKKEMP